MNNKFVRYYTFIFEAFASNHQLVACSIAHNQNELKLEKIDKYIFGSFWTRIENKTFAYFSVYNMSQDQFHLESVWSYLIS